MSFWTVAETSWNHFFRWTPQFQKLGQPHWLERETAIEPAPSWQLRILRRAEALHAKVTWKIIISNRNLRVKSILRNSQQTSLMRSPSTPEPPTQSVVQTAVKLPLALNTTTVAIARGSTPPPSSDPPAQPMRKEKKHKAKQGNKWERQISIFAVHFFTCFSAAAREISAGLSALYAKLLVVLGIAFPIAEVLSVKVPSTFDQVRYCVCSLDNNLCQNMATSKMTTNLA